MRHRLLAVVIAAALSSGCVGKYYNAKCLDMGHAAGSPAHADCVTNEREDKRAVRNWFGEFFYAAVPPALRFILP